jgi:hypothetical protein
MLFLVEGRGWGHVYAVVRADSAAEAERLSGASGMRSIEIISLDPGGPAAVLWCDEDSPDSVRERD